MKCVASMALAVALAAGQAEAAEEDWVWSGGYFGAQGGTLLRSRVSGALTYNDPAFPGVTAANLFSDTSRQIDLSKSALAGWQFGWNWQLGPLVAGVEADMSYVDAKGSKDASTDLVLCPTPCTTWHITTDWHSLGTLRGRLGAALGPVLFYGTAGFAWAIVRTNNNVDCVGCTSSPWAWGKSNESHLGVAYGGGVEWMLAPHVTIKAEYLAANLGSVSHTFVGQAHSGTTVVDPGPPPLYDYRSDGFNHDLTFSSVRGAFIFKF